MCILTGVNAFFFYLPCIVLSFGFQKFPLISAKSSGKGRRIWHSQDPGKLSKFAINFALQKARIKTRPSKGLGREIKICRRAAVEGKVEGETKKKSLDSRRFSWKKPFA